MEFSYKNLPNFDMRKAERKAKMLWHDLSEDKIEIKFVTSPLGLMLAAAGVIGLICLTKCIGKMEKCSALKKEVKRCQKEKDE